MRVVAVSLVAALALWVAAIVAAPVAAGSRHDAPVVCALATYTAGSFVCHQRPERSFHIAGRPLAVCGRCTGLYVSGLAGGVAMLLAGAAGKPRSTSHDRPLLCAAAVPTALSWSLEHAGLAAQSNAIRAAAALPLGFAAAWVVVALLLCSAAPTHGAGPAGYRPGGS